MPTGVNLNRYSGPSSCIRWHSDNDPLFGKQNSPKPIVSLSLGISVEFKVRRGQGNVPSLITLDHSDLLVMDGLTQSEYVHCTASGLQGPRVNLTFRELRSTLRPVHSQARWAVSSLRVCKV